MVGLIHTAVGEMWTHYIQSQSRNQIEVLAAFLSSFMADFPHTTWLLYLEVELEPEILLPLILYKETKPHIFIPIHLGSLRRWETQTFPILLDPGIQSP